jgi:peptidoglycan/xylan/chitin deacetylase (PgdA/CDA1 family)
MTLKIRTYKFPKWLKGFYPKAIWDFSVKAGDVSPKKSIYLTFDDGPNPKTTPWLLELLDKHKAKATFFCLGKNVRDHADLFQEIIAKGHAVANHSMHHLNGWQTKKEEYVNDVMEAQQYIPSNLFRPPYGRMKKGQHRAIKALGLTTVFWSHITYDFDAKLSSENRTKRTKKAVKNGAILVFHDSEKAFPQLQKELPKLLDYAQKEGFHFSKIEA